MSYNSVEANPIEYGEPPESCAEECKALCKGKTVNELQQISEYFAKEARDLDNKVDSTVTYDDFNKLKKGPDGDKIQNPNDNEDYAEEEADSGKYYG